VNPLAADPVAPDGFDPLDDLMARARASGAAVMTALAGRMLIGRGAPRAPAQGVALLNEAAAAGSCDALEALATLTGAGAWTAQSWPVALDLLAAAADAGSARARRQLAVLAGEDELARALGEGQAEGADWRGLRRGIDLEPWLAPAERRSLCEKPRIRAADRFASLGACEWLVDQCRGKLTASMMFNGQRSVFLATRTCSDYVFDLVGGGLVLVLVRERISATTRMPTACMEPPQVFHYAEGQEIKPHFDFLYDGKSGYGGDYHGDRIATFLLYLNDDFEGGELEFPRVGVRHRGAKGDGVYFAHVSDEGRREPLSLHAGLPILRGEKYILSQWIHDRTFVANLREARASPGGSAL
jgi:hypothetical protein